jgi:hypothetical protein
VTRWFIAVFTHHWTQMLSQMNLLRSSGSWRRVTVDGDLREKDHSRHTPWETDVSDGSISRPDILLSLLINLPVHGSFRLYLSRDLLAKFVSSFLVSFEEHAGFIVTFLIQHSYIGRPITVTLISYSWGSLSQHIADVRFPGGRDSLCMRNVALNVLINPVEPKLV